MYVQYDETLIVKYAAKLYRHAKMIIVIWTLGGFIGSYLASAVLFSIGRGNGRDAPIFFVAVIGGIVGFLIGESKAFWYRLQAQLALCQVQIEHNTRNADAPTAWPGNDDEGFIPSLRPSSPLEPPPPSQPVFEPVIAPPRYCGECGAPVESAAASCAACGKPVAGAES